MEQFRNHIYRFGKIIPFVGIFWVLANANQTFKRKGYVLGTVEVLLDICPVICVVKAVVESYTGDLIPAKPATKARPGRPRLHTVTADA